MTAIEKELEQQAHELAMYQFNLAEEYNLECEDYTDPNEVYDYYFKQYKLESMTPQQDFSDIPF